MDELEGLEIDDLVRHLQVLGLAGDHPVEADGHREIAHQPRAGGRVGPPRPSLAQDLEGTVLEGEGREHRGGLAVGHVTGGPAPAHPRVVHAGQVVEDEARGVHHLDGAGRGKHALGVALQDLGHQEGEDGAQPLARGEEAVFDGRGHRRGLAGGEQTSQRLVHLDAASLEHGLEAGGGSGGCAHLQVFGPG